MGVCLLDTSEKYTFVTSTCRSSSDLLGSSMGVFVGCIWTEYGELLQRQQDSSSGTSSSQVVTGNGLAFMSGRVSYTFGLTGKFGKISAACLLHTHLHHVCVLQAQAYSPKPGERRVSSKPGN